MKEITLEAIEQCLIKILKEEPFDGCYNDVWVTKYLTPQQIKEALDECSTLKL